MSGAKDEVQFWIKIILLAIVIYTKSTKRPNWKFLVTSELFATMGCEYVHWAPIPRLVLRKKPTPTEARRPLKRSLTLLVTLLLPSYILRLPSWQKMCERRTPHENSRSGYERWTAEVYNMSPPCASLPRRGLLKIINRIKNKRYMKYYIIVSEF